MKKKILSVIALASLGCVSVVQAGGRYGDYDSLSGYHSSFDYTYLEGGYNYSDFSAIEDHGDGGYVKGSLGFDKFAPNSFLSGLSATGAYGEDHFGSNKLDHYNFGLNYHSTIARNLDLVGGASYLKDFSHSYGVAGDLGVRYKPIRKLELDLGEGYTSYTSSDLDLDHKWTTHGGAVYSLWRNVAGTVNIDYNHVDGAGFSTDYTVYGVGARVYF